MYLTPIEHNCVSVDMSTCPTTQINNGSSNVFRPTDPSVRTRLAQRLLPARLLHQSGCHFAHEKTGRNTVDEDATRTQFNGEVANEMQHGGFGCGVRVRT